MNFHSTEPEEMRRITLFAAEHVLGILSWHVSGSWYTPTIRGCQVAPIQGRGNAERHVWSIGGDRPWISRYLTDANADYEVLKHVRETWGQPLLISYEAALAAAWQYRQQDDVAHADWILCYEIGDYTRAACTVKAEELKCR